ncbi:cation efflux protein [Mycena leptocephala]|nr:cation efflux protein [Mycena leptocephala]
MPAPDAKTRNKISLSPRVFSTSIPSKYIPKIVVTSVLYATSLHAGKGLLDFDVGVFWVVMRVLACAGFGVLVWEGRTGQLAKRKSIETIGILAPSLGSTFTIAASALGASGFALPFYVFRTVVLDFPSTPAIPLLSLAPLPFLAFSLLFFSPITARSLSHLSFTPQHFMLSYPSTSIFAAILGPLAFSQFPTWTDAAVAILLYFGMQPEKIDAFPVAPRTSTSRLIRSYLKTILSNPESRKIFYFLMLNMAYMLVQMLYGVWTNSLGLISDAIHMAFDCMAIGVGLFASVMATWEPNERFTYGYGRIETLSGFANGIFLILISIFIVFEAIQRLLEPPEMNTSQLLLVSSLGLAVNLFGMFAMGGHHHGGHSHSHGHSHGHSHSQNDSHGHSEHGSPPIGFNDHGHSHSPPHSPLSPPPHSHSPPLTPSHSHSHSHSPPLSLGHSHSHSQPCVEDHSHSHSEPSAQDHSHSHSPPPSPSATHAHSHSPVSPHAHSHSPPSPEHRGQPPTPVDAKLRRHFSGPSLHVHGKPPSSPMFELGTPITPNYQFGVDEHYKTHHEDEHIPNLHNPSHAPSHEGHSHNMRGVFLHVMADTLGSVGVIISTLLIQFYGWTGFDPIASLFIAILIAAMLCLDVSDREATIDQALAELHSIEGLASFKAPRFWPKDATTLIGSIHIQLAPSASSFDPSGPHSNQRPTYAKLDRVVERVDSLLRRRISGLEELTIQVEEYNSGYT